MRTATLRKEGIRQSVELPEGYRFEGEKVYMNKIGNVVVLIPEENPWDTLFESLDRFTDDFMDVRNQPQAQTREEIFT